MPTAPVPGTVAGATMFSDKSFAKAIFSFYSISFLYLNLLGSVLPILILRFSSYSW